MKDLLLSAAPSAAALLVIALVVGPGRDTGVLVSPPEAVAEEFMQKLGTGKYDMAVTHLEDDSAASRARIRSIGEALRERAGSINQVEGEKGTISGDTAIAFARIETERAGELRWSFRLIRRDGVWRIRALEEERAAQAARFDRRVHALAGW